MVAEEREQGLPFTPVLMQVHREPRLALKPLHALRPRLVGVEVSRVAHAMPVRLLQVDPEPDALGIYEDDVGVEQDPVPAQREFPGVVDVDVEGIGPRLP